jgi:hypothetical protein
MYSFDISWVDQGTHKYYVADRSNAAVDIVDTNTNTLLGQLAATPPFAGFIGTPGRSGPNGVVTGGNCLFVTDAPSRVVSFNTTNFPPTQVSDVRTSNTSPNRADELAYDPNDGLLLVVNNEDTPPFATLITVNQGCTLTLGQQIIFDAAHGVDAQNGAEQPVWEPVTGKFYLSIPQIGTQNVTIGAVIRISTTGTVEATYTIPFCQPAGLTVGPNVNLLAGCSVTFDTAGDIWNPTANVTAAPQLVILDAETGNILANVLGVGTGDEVWFNSGDGNYYAASSGSPLRPLDLALPEDAQGAAILGVIGAKGKNLLQLVPTFNVPAVGTGNSSTEHPASTAHSVAVDAGNNHIFVPLGANNVFPMCLTGCIAVFSAL